MWTVTGVGLMDSTPLEITGASAPMNQLQVTWDPGIGIAPTAREVDVTDIASSPNSLLDNLVVDGVQVWTVNKAGVLVHGTVPASAIPGIFNNPTFTGTSTFNGPVDMTAGLTVTGGETVDNLTVTGALTALGGPVTFSTIDTSDINNSGIITTATLASTTINNSGNLTVDGTSTFDGPAVFNSSVTFAAGGPVGGCFEYGQNQNPSGSGIMSIPGTISQMWALMANFIVQLSAPLVTGTITIAGSGSTEGGSGWNAYSYTLTNPGQTIIPMSLIGDIFGGQIASFSITVTGGTLDFVNWTAIANRFS